MREGRIGMEDMDEEADGDPLTKQNLQLQKIFDYNSILNVSKFSLMP